MKKNIVISFIVIIILGIIITLILKNTYSLEEKEEIDILNNNLIYSEDNSLLKNELTEYIDDIDDYLFPTARFYNSDILIENYNFITNFIIFYINNNRDKYSKYIIDNDYINKDTFYKLSKKYFNIDYYYEDDINNLNSIYLTNNSYIKANMTIDDLNIISINNNHLKVKVKYKEVSFSYIYDFIIDNNYIYIYNLEY